MFGRKLCATQKYQLIAEIYTSKTLLHVSCVPPHAKKRCGEICRLTPKHKADLVALLNVDVSMARGVMSGLSSIEQAVESLVRLYEGADEACLEMPRLMGLRQNVREM